MLSKASNVELLMELAKRLGAVKKAAPPLKITPYQIMCIMEKEDLRINGGSGNVMNTCLELAGYETSESFLNYGRKIGLNELEPGDIVVSEKCGVTPRSHVAFVKIVGFNFIEVVGGNREDGIDTKKYFMNSAGTYQTFRRITDMNKIGEPDRKALEGLGII